MAAAVFAVALVSAASVVRSGAAPALQDQRVAELLDQGRSELGRGLPGLARAVSLFDEAVRLAPRSAATQTALAHAYVELGRLGALPPEQAFPAARALALSALASDDLPRAHLVLGEVAFFYDWDRAGADVSFRRALAREPESPLNLALYAQHLSTFGRHAEALAAIGHAARLAPSLPWVLEESARCHYRARLFAEAAADWNRALHAGAAPAMSHWGRMLAYRQLGRVPDMAREARAVLTSSGASGPELAELDRLPPARTMEWLLERRVARLQRPEGAERPRAEQLALALAALGQGDRALAWVEKAVAARAPFLPTTLAAPEFDRLRRDPRFPRLAG